MSKNNLLSKESTIATLLQSESSGALNPPLFTSTAVLVLGDHLSSDHPLLSNGQQTSTVVLMVESKHESLRVMSHKARTALFLSAMRHYAQALKAKSWTVHYSDLDETAEHILSTQVARLCAMHHIHTLHVLEPGEWRLEQELMSACKSVGVDLHIHSDPHFLCSRAQFKAWAGQYRQLRMEYFYRHMRQTTGVLMQNGKPLGEQFNFDADNRKAFPKAGPGNITAPLRFQPDGITLQVFEDVTRTMPELPGAIADFAWPVTRDDALKAMEHFMQHRLAEFGPYQDAMWANTPFGWHSLLASALNLHLLHPMEVIQSAVNALDAGKASLASVEGFVRQILGWREFIRGVYCLDMPGMFEANHYDALRQLPDWFWTGKTHMQCLHHSIAQTLQYGYAHHIQRLMVIGNFALLAGLNPKAVANWFLAVYVDAVEWVELPNVAGMALFANGGRFTSKPYIASGAYISRMSNYCQECRYKPSVKTGPSACPYTLLYWAFIDQHEAELQSNPRTSLMAKNIQRLSEVERETLRAETQTMLQNLDDL